MDARIKKRRQHAHDVPRKPGPPAQRSTRLDAAADARSTQALIRRANANSKAGVSHTRELQTYAQQPHRPLTRVPSATHAHAHSNDHAQHENITEGDYSRATARTASVGDDQSVQHARMQGLQEEEEEEEEEVEG